MRISKLWSSGAAVALALGLAASAKAGLVTVTYQGVVTSGHDMTGEFGAPGGNLAEDSFTVVYTLDDSVPVSGNSDRNDPPSYSDLLGEPGFMSETVTINGITKKIPVSSDIFSETHLSTLDSGSPNYSATDAMILDNTETTLGSGAHAHLIDVDSEISSPINAFIANSDYHTPFTYMMQAGDAASGVYSDWELDDQTVDIDTYASLAPTSVTVADIPEPTTWALLILGVGMIGFAARRRNAGAAIAA